MSNLIVDTNRLSECGQDLMKLSSELNEEFNALFSRISNMNIKTLEWVGNASQEFIRKTNIEKIQYNNLKNDVYKYGKGLYDISNFYDEIVRKVG